MATHKKQAIQRVGHDLGLPLGDSFTQDWVHELGEEYRTEEDLERYLAAYRKPAYGVDERALLLDLILDVVNDLTEEDPSVGARVWTRVVGLLGADLLLHRPALDYWAVPEESLDNAFALSPLVRAFLAMHGTAAR
jgi:hypothetical protein